MTTAQTPMTRDSTKKTASRQCPLRTARENSCCTPQRSPDRRARGHQRHGQMPAGRTERREAASAAIDWTWLACGANHATATSIARTARRCAITHPSSINDLSSVSVHRHGAFELTGGAATLHITSDACSSYSKYIDGIRGHTPMLCISRACLACLACLACPPDLSAALPALPSPTRLIRPPCQPCLPPPASHLPCLPCPPCPTHPHFRPPPDPPTRLSPTRGPANPPNSPLLNPCGRMIVNFVRGSPWD